ncbi:hypothetical protein CRENBAI_011381 [Crenichthys baileyi]|uniref:Uncharacterized protein n=1 Tax=Crenichthys baileyi TaxID=28760 RepID=A0AAV9R970_9TELE
MRPQISQIFRRFCREAVDLFTVGKRSAHPPAPGRGRNVSQRPVPNPKAQECDPLIHWGKPHHKTAELWGNKQTHPSPPPFPVGHSRVEESPAPLEESQPKHPGIGLPRSPPSSDAQSSLHRSLMFPPAGGGPTSLASRLSFGLSLARSHEEQPSHQALSNESRPQPCLQGGTPAPPYRATSPASM